MKTKLQKYMIYTRGNIRDQLLGGGIKFDPSTMYMLVNHYNYEEEKIDMIDDGTEDGKVDQKHDKEEKDPTGSKGACKYYISTLGVGREYEGNAYFAYLGGGGPELGKTCLYNTCTLPYARTIRLMK